MKSVTVCSHRAPTAPPSQADGAMLAAGFGMVLPVPFMVVPSMWQRWQLYVTS